METRATEGVARALVASFAAADQIWFSNPERARAGLLVVAKSLPQVPEWSGLVDALEQLCDPSASRLNGGVTPAQQEAFEERLKSIETRARLVPGGWDEELDREFNEVMAAMRSAKG